jgi:hypothetical protein
MNRLPINSLASDLQSTCCRDHFVKNLVVLSFSAIIFVLFNYIVYLLELSDLNTLC